MALSSGAVSRRAAPTAPRAPRRESEATRPSMWAASGIMMRTLARDDAHLGSRKVLTPRGEWATPILFGVLDDRSRLACHLQWYLSETAEVVAHGLSQAFQKRGLPRSSLSDNGAAMTAAEVAEGLTR